MTTRFFNSPPVQEFLPLAFPELRELALWVYDRTPPPPSDPAPSPFAVSPTLHPKLAKLSLVGVPLSMEGSLEFLRDLALCDYPPGAPPLEWLGFISLFNSAESLNRLVLRRYLGSVRKLPSHIQTSTLPTLDSVVVEETSYNVWYVSEWMETWENDPLHTHFISNNVITNLVDRRSPIDQESLFMDVLARRWEPASDPFHLALVPRAFNGVTDATLTFGSTSITLKCIGYQPGNDLNWRPVEVIIELRCNDLMRLDPDSRTRVHAIAIKSVKWILWYAAGKALRKLEIIGVSDDVCADAWDTLLSIVDINPKSPWRALIIRPNNPMRHAAAELYRALYKRQHELPKDLQVFAIQGTETSPFGRLFLLVTMTSYRNTQDAIVQRAEFCPPLTPTTRVDLSVLQQYAATITVLELGPMTHATFLAVDVPMLLVRAMPQLTTFKLVLQPPSTRGSGTVLPRVLIRPERLPALRSLHLEGATLVCDSLALLKRLELRNAIGAPLGHTFAEFLAMLSTAVSLDDLVLENYMGRMGAGDPTTFHFPLTCKTAFAKDTTRSLYRLLAHLSEVPEDMRMVAWSPDGSPADLDLLPLKGLTPPLQKSVHCATFKFTPDGVQLICAGSKHKISIEHSVSPMLVAATSSVHNVALDVLSRFLAFMPISTLEIADPTDDIDPQAWFDLLALAPNVSELIVEQRGPGGAVRNIFTALASFSGQAVETAVRCPHLKDVKVRGATYSPLLVDMIGQSAKWRAEHRGSFRSLHLVLTPRFLGQPRCEFASAAARGWATKLQTNGYVGRVIVKDVVGNQSTSSDKLDRDAIDRVYSIA
ncbi:hypothetical protein C8T65DRAFT_824909 [Cerioporus squamosus]|nr:hypothetical protein C8T65DRAFT_824909 [Cerioporus squamosus]